MVTVLLVLLGRLDLTMLTALRSLLLLFFSPHGMLAPQPGIKPVLPALAAQSLYFLKNTSGPPIIPTLTSHPPTPPI